MQRVEVEGDDAAATDRHVENRRTADQVRLAPHLAAEQERLIRRLIAPLHHHWVGVRRSVETRRAERHAQPAARRRIERIVLSEHMRVCRIAIRDRMIGLRERNANVCSRCTSGRLHCGLCAFGAATAGTARRATRIASDAANNAAFECERGPTAERHEHTAALDELLNLRESFPTYA